MVYENRDAFHLKKKYFR